MRTYSARQLRVRAARNSMFVRIDHDRAPVIEKPVVHATRDTRRPVINSLAQWAAVHNAR